MRTERNDQAPRVRGGSTLADRWDLTRRRYLDLARLAGQRCRGPAA